MSSPSAFRDSRRSAILRSWARSCAVLRRAAFRAIERSRSRRSSSSRSWSTTLISVICAPWRRRILTRWSPSSRCSASRTGVRPMPSLALSSASDQMLPGARCRETIISSSRARACSERPGRGVLDERTASARARAVVAGALASDLGRLARVVVIGRVRLVMAQGSALQHTDLALPRLAR